MNKYLNFSPLYFFCLYGIVFVFFTFCVNYILFDDTLYYESLKDLLGFDRIRQIIEQQRFFQKIGYGVIPLVLFLRTFYTTICLVTGAFISEQRLTFGQCFNIAIKADIIFLFELIFKIDYFSIFGARSLQEVGGHLFSVLQWIEIDNIQQWLTYPLDVLNVFELGYWIVLAMFLAYYTKKSFGASLGFVTKTYGLGVLLWVIFVVYITVFLF